MIANFRPLLCFTMSLGASPHHANGWAYVGWYGWMHAHICERDRRIIETQPLFREMVLEVSRKVS